MQEDKWETLTTKQRIDALQTVANIEAHYLGLLNELNVGASNLREFALGCYSDKTHTISIDIEHLENDPVYEVLDTCCHEAYHSYQHRLVDVYNTTDTSSKCLRLYKKPLRIRRNLEIMRMDMKISVPIITKNARAMHGIIWKRRF